jgi:hypothetical protein
MWRFLILPDSLFASQAPARSSPRPQTDPPFFYSVYVLKTCGFFWRIHPLLFLVFCRVWVVAVRPSFDSYETFIR